MEAFLNPLPTYFNAIGVDPTEFQATLGKVIFGCTNYLIMLVELVVLFYSNLVEALVVLFL
jgi:hypothetical protein